MARRPDAYRTPPTRSSRYSDTSADDLAYIHRRRERAEQCRKFWLGATIAALMGTATNWPLVLDMLMRLIQWLDLHVTVR